jgi:hypothetical protein
MTSNIRRVFGTDLSYPLDWTLTPIAGLIALFRAGLDQEICEENLEPSKWGGSILNRKYGLRYVHDFHVDEDWREEIPGVARKYEFRTRRFIDTIRSRPVILWYNIAPEDNFTPGEMFAMRQPTLQSLLRLAIRSRFPMAAVRYIAPEKRETGRVEGMEWAGSRDAWNEAFRQQGFPA